VSESAAGMILADIASRGATLYGARPAIHTGDRSTTFRELYADTCRMTARLAAAGVGPGTRVAVLSGNRVQYLHALFAASFLGAVVVPLNSRLSADDVRFQLSDSGATHGLVESPFSDLADRAGMSNLTCWPIDTGSSSPDDLATSFDELRAAGVVRAARSTDPIVQLYTSGTTGRPKGCLLTQGGWLASNLNLAHRLGTRGDDVLLGVYPLFHVAGLGLALTHLMAGAAVVFPRGADPATLWSTVERYGVTVAGFPGLAAALQFPDATRLGRTLRVVFGGANMESRTTLERLTESLPTAEFLGIYGSTEGGNVVTISTLADELERPGTIGRPLLGFDAIILDEDDRALPPGTEGVLGLRGASVMIGYAGRAEATEAALRSGWLHTGDIMRFDEDGYLYFVDRDKDMIKPGGENVYSIEVERILLAHPAVADVAVFGVADERWGEAVKALVVRHPSASVTAEDLDEYCLEHLAAFKRPRWYEFTDAIARSVTGKLVKRQLRKDHDPARAVRLAERSRR
jgi:acyl-CoA synthetase (AMP-forming)/AMP-acid ligase II